MVHGGSFACNSILIPERLLHKASIIAQLNNCQSRGGQFSNLLVPFVMFGFILPRVVFEWLYRWPWHSRRQWNWNAFWILGTGIGNAQLSSKIRERESEMLSLVLKFGNGNQNVIIYYLSVKVANNKIFCKGKWHFPIENLDNWINPLYSVAFVVYLTATKRKPGISITKIKKILTIGPTRSVAA